MAGLLSKPWDLNNHMNKEMDIPEEVRRWNWGAFLLCPIWCIRHGIWQGLLLLIPIFGLFVPFWLGATGNRKAWAKKGHESKESFLKRQKFWGFAGLGIWIGALLTSLGTLSYSLNYSDGMKMGLATANTNKRLTEYFGKNIRKRSFFNGSYNYVISPEPSTLTVAFDAVGSRNEGNIHFQWEKRGKDWVTTEITFVDAEGSAHQLVDMATLASSFLPRAPYNKNRLETALSHMIQEKDGFLILSRSKEKNDFIQTAAELLDNGEVVFSVVYSDGYTKWNKSLYQSKIPQSKDEVIKLFTLYARGDDSHIHLIEWNKLTSIQPTEGSSAFFIFGEPAI